MRSLGNGQYMRYEIIDKYGKLAHAYHDKTLSAAKHFVDTHRKCFIWDNVLKKIIYPKECQEEEK